MMTGLALVGMPRERARCEAIPRFGPPRPAVPPLAPPGPLPVRDRHLPLPAPRGRPRLLGARIGTGPQARSARRVVSPDRGRCADRPTTSGSASRSITSSSSRSASSRRLSIPASTIRLSADLRPGGLQPRVGSHPRGTLQPRVGSYPSRTLQPRGDRISRRLIGHDAAGLRVHLTARLDFGPTRRGPAPRASWPPPPGSSAPRAPGW